MTLNQKIQMFRLSDEEGTKAIGVDVLKKILKYDSQITEKFKKKFPKSPFSWSIRIPVQLGRVKSKLITNDHGKYMITASSDVAYLDIKVVNKLCK